jgi:hypothetical protein
MLRGDGSIKKDWEEAQRQEDPKTPSSGGSGLQVAWLRERHHNSNFFWVRIPLEIRNSARGEKVFSITEATLQSSLEISAGGIMHLRECGLILPFIAEKITRPRIDYVALEQTYRRMLDDGPFTTQTELARHLGVSRVWVSRVLKGMWKKAG